MKPAPEEFLTSSGKLKRYTKPQPIEYDTRLAIPVNSDTKSRFKACAAYLDMSESDTLQIILQEYIQRVVSFAGENCQPEQEIAFMDAGRMVQSG